MQVKNSCKQYPPASSHPRLHSSLAFVSPPSCSFHHPQQRHGTVRGRRAAGQRSWSSNHDIQEDLFLKRRSTCRNGQKEGKKGSFVKIPLHVVSQPACTVLYQIRLIARAHNIYDLSRTTPLRSISAVDDEWSKEASWID